jgi:selenide,water dikinase
VQSAELTTFSKGSGCGCKINPESLKALLQGLTLPDDYPGIVVGNSMADDCSVLDLGNGQYLLQTVDFFTPIVNDAYVFGAAAAANAISDIFAMGGKPLMANAVFSWPLDKLPVDLGREVLRGASDICKKAGVPLAGGHSIDGQEPLFGLSVTGIVAAENLKKNSGAMAGDIILLTKPLGVGMLAAAHKRGVATPEQNEALFAALVTLNSAGEKLGGLPSVHAMTDVTGFGLAGHLLEMCEAAGLGADIQISALPMIEEAKPLAASFVLPDNAMRNWNAYQSKIQLGADAAFPWLSDPQTNGGLLVAVASSALNDVLAVCPDARVIGTFNSDITGIRVQG